MDWEHLKEGQPINLVLSGGGSKGVAHVALLQKLLDLNVPIKAISGTSAGALVATLHASGMKPQGIYSFFKETKLFNYSWINITKPGIFDTVQYKKILEKNLPSDFSDLNIPVYLAATNLEHGSADYFNAGPLIDPLLASCAVPAIFSPVQVNGYLYADGGISDNFPLKPFKSEETPIVGSYVNSPNYRSQKDLKSITSVSKYAGELLLYNANQYKFSETTFTVEFPLGEFSFLDMKVVPEMYEKACAHLDIKPGF
jgi:NTE family protein